MGNRLHGSRESIVWLALVPAFFIAGCGAAPTPNAVSTVATLLRQSPAAPLATSVARTPPALDVTTVLTETRTRPSPTPTRRPPLRPPTAVPTSPPLQMNERGALGTEWEATLVGIHRDKTLSWGTSTRTAFGVFATFVLRIRNLQSGPAYIGKGVLWAAVDETGRIFRYDPIDAPDGYAAHMFCKCANFYNTVQPGTETLAVLVIDVWESSRVLRLVPFVRTSLGIISVDPSFIVPEFGQVPAYQPNN